MGINSWGYFSVSPQRQGPNHSLPASPRTATGAASAAGRLLDCIDVIGGQYSAFAHPTLLLYSREPRDCRPTSNTRLDILIHAKEVRRIVLVLKGDEACVI